MNYKCLNYKCLNYKCLNYKYLNYKCLDYKCLDYKCYQIEKRIIRFIIEGLNEIKIIKYKNKSIWKFIISNQLIGLIFILNSK